MRKLFTSKSAGKSSRLILKLTAAIVATNIAWSMPAFAFGDSPNGVTGLSAEDLSLDFMNLPANAQVPREPAAASLTAKSEDEALWQRFEKTIQNKKRADYINGLSFVISGTLAIVGGNIGQGYSSDPLEKGVYTLFQTIGIASVGYGAYTWKIGSDDRFLYETIAHVNGLDEKAKIAVIRSYFEQRKERERQERFIKMLTHGMIAVFNLYNATQQTNESIKNGMFFIGGVNLLASVTYAF